MRGDKTALPDAFAIVLCHRRVVFELALDERFGAQGKTLAHKLLVQAQRVALCGAKADMAFLEGLVGTEIVAAHSASLDQLGQLVSRFDAAGPGIGVVVDAHLIDFRRVDAIEPVGDLAELNGVAIPDDSACRPARPPGQNNGEGEQRPKRQKTIA